MTAYITQTIEPWMPAGALKAKDDYAKIAAASNWKILPLERYNDQRFGQGVRQEKIRTWTKNLSAGDIVLHQFPSYMSQAFEEGFSQSLSQVGVKKALLIHDLEPLRLKKENPWEFALLKHYDLIVVHSPAMANKLREHGIDKPFVVQGLFDYLGPVPAGAEYSKKINFAGTFQKSPWLQEYAGPEITLFGSKPKKWRDFDFPADITWRGNYAPDEIAFEFKSGFGLLWDNDFDDKKYQSYTRWNAPHKASLYLKAGLPLIAWSQSYLGQVIKSQGIGLTIDDLSQLKRVADVTVQQYQDWQTNLQPLADKVNAGRYSQKVLTAIKKQLS
ncbi:sugar transferase [Eupransor demetentiae]|uniref:Glycosyltransferase involved in cell wall bisynthesis (RfaB) n=1 Tax=Eupransor demetentiae TaxID=3109584 RepID=A0ABP0ERY5_9LACO|nr:Glycosyltransferase involved in cell wall bisynthesis (RfaB) [Lactobacillaceae bacterium LMG 33000]